MMENNNTNSSLPEDGVDITYRLVLYIVGIPLGGCALLGNLFLLMAMIRFSKLQTRANVAVVSLSASDALAGAMLLAHLSSVHLQHQIANTHLCYLWAVVQLMPMVACFLHLTFVSVDRLVAVTRAVHYTDSMSARRIAVYVGVLWTYILVLTVLVFAFTDHDVTLDVCDVTILPWGYMLLVLVGHILPASLVVVVIFAWIQRTLRIHQRKIQVTNTMTYNNLLADITVARLFFFTFVFVAILWGTFFITELVWIAGVDSSSLILIIRITFLVGNLSYIKFFIYIVLNSEFRKYLKKALSCKKNSQSIVLKRASTA